MRFLIALLLSTLTSLIWAANNSLSPSTYEELNAIQEQLAAQQYREAEEALLELEDDLNPGFGLALTYQLHGQLNLLQEKNKEAMLWYSKALALNVLAPAQESALSTTIAQLHLAAENNNAAIAELEPRLNNILSLEKDKNSDKKRGTDVKPVDWHRRISWRKTTQRPFPG
jgi:tetratricopeptide (TPR) repeat protein